MKKRKFEFVLTLIAVAVVALFVANKPETVKPVTKEAAAPQAALPPAPKVRLSDDAKWLITTAADSYSPRVEVEKAWQDPNQTVKPGPK